MCGIFSLLYELYIKSKLHVHSVISHCVSCKHVIRKKFNNCQSSMSVVLPLVWYTCRFVSPFRRHTLIHMYTQPHTHAHGTHKYMHVIHTHNITCTHVHTQHHVNAGWILSSLFCKPGGAWQDSGNSPSGWGYGRPTGQGWKLLFVTLDKWCAFKLEQFCGTSCTFETRISIDNLIPCMLVSILTWLNPWYTSQIMVLTF